VPHDKLFQASLYQNSVTQKNTMLSPLVMMVVVYICCVVNTSRADMLEILAVDYPPYEFEQPRDGLKGFDVDVVEEVLRRVGSASSIKFMPWARARQMVFDGKGFALLSCGKSKKREPYLVYSDAISQVTWGYFVRKNFDGAAVKNAEGFRNKKVTVVRDYRQHAELEDLGINIHIVRTDELAIKVLVGNHMDYLYLPKEAAAFHAKNMGVNEKITFIPFSKKDLFLCFSKQWPEVEGIRKTFNQGLKELRADGTYDAIHEKYN